MVTKIIDQHEKLRLSFRHGLALPLKFDVASAEMTTMGQWDSVAHLQLVVAIEDAYGIRLSPGDVIDLKSYGTAVVILKSHGVWSNV
jgi:hypothetical protein